MDEIKFDFKTGSVTTIGLISDDFNFSTECAKELAKEYNINIKNVKIITYNGQKTKNVPCEIFPRIVEIKSQRNVNKEN